MGFKHVFYTWHNQSKKPIQKKKILVSAIFYELFRLEGFAGNSYIPMPIYSLYCDHVI
jgi:hypothetical protein